MTNDTETDNWCYTKKEARVRLAAGVDKVTDVVKATLGPMGRNVALEQDWNMGARTNPPLITNDGVTIAHVIDDRDPYIQMGCNLVKSAAHATQDTAGDGTTTVCILTQAIMSAGMEMVDQGVDPMTIKRQLLTVSARLLDAVKEERQDVEDYDQKEQVAIISANNDPEIGAMVATAIHTVGTDGAVTVEESGRLENETVFVDGLVVDGGFISPYMMTDQAKGMCVVEDVHVVCVNGDVTEIPESMGTILKDILRKHAKILIVAQNITPSALIPMLENNKNHKTVWMVGMKHPGYGHNKEPTMRDIAAFTGATVIGDQVNEDMSVLGWDDMGHAEKVIMHTDRTVFIGGNGDAKDRIKEIEQQIKEEPFEQHKRDMETRLGRLKGKVAILRLGAATETEYQEKLLRVDDALQATRAAVDEGVVRGGGVALWRAREHLDENKDKVGTKILKQAAGAPLQQIFTNAGIKVPQKVGDGYYLKPDGTVKSVDMFQAGILDPFKVTRCAVENAVSMAAMILTTDAVVRQPKDEPEGIGLRKRE